MRWVRNAACRSRPPATCTCTCANAVRLQDALTAVRHGVTLAEAGERLFANGERHLRERERLARLYPAELLAETVKIAALADFSLDELRYEYPRELVPPGETPASHLRKLTEAGALQALAGAASRKTCAPGSTTSSRSSPISNTSPTSSRCTTS